MKKRQPKKVSPPAVYPEGMIIAVSKEMQKDLLAIRQEQVNGRVLMDHGAEKVRVNQELMWKKIRDEYPGLARRKCMYNGELGTILVGGYESE